MLQFKAEVQHIRTFLEDILDSTLYNTFYVVLVLLDIFCFALQSSENIPNQSIWYLEATQLLFLAYYQLEAVVAFFVKGKSSLLKDRCWNGFGLTLGLLDLLGLVLPVVIHSFGLSKFGTNHAINILALFKFIRVLRAVRAIRFLKSLQIIVVTLVAALPTIGAILVIMSVVLYIFAIIGRDLYGSRDPGRYGNLALAGASLFQLLTLDDWFEMYTDVANNGFQHILFFLIIFIIIESLIFVSLFVAVIVDNLARARNTFDSISKNDEESMNQEQFAEKKDSIGPVLIHTSGDWNEQYLAALNSLKVQLRMESLHSKTLERLVDMVDLSKLDQTV